MFNSLPVRKSPPHYPFLPCFKPVLADEKKKQPEHHPMPKNPKKRIYASQKVSMFNRLRRKRKRCLWEVFFPVFYFFG
ncbi:hypothetical protein Barb6_03637 [Bacteroidales bacterium Barb6]|nr:hypothetical protein Barb6_03637 [Bacteroidales bacterium Barb6]